MTNFQADLPTLGRFFRAVVEDDSATVKAILIDGFEFSQYRIGGKSFFRHAAEIRHRNTCEVLLKYGADPDERYGRQRRSLLHTAAATGNFGVASLLLSVGASPSPRTSNNATPLHLATRGGEAYLADRLIEAGADIDAQDSVGRSPLLLAFEKSKLDVAKLLVRRQANARLPDKRGRTPRLVAEEKGPPYSLVFSSR